MVGEAVDEKEVGGMKIAACLLLAVALFLAAETGFCDEEVLFGFEDGIANWEIPDWCFEDDSYAGGGISTSIRYAKDGVSSLELLVDFPGAKWTAAYAEVQKYFDWSPYKAISIDVFLPDGAPIGLKAKIILTVGEDWTWTEMSSSIDLVPGKWTTVTAGIVPGSVDWRGAKVLDEFRSDVRKLGIRIESNMQPAYSGPLYIDNVRLEKLDQDTGYMPYDYGTVEY